MINRILKYIKDNSGWSLESANKLLLFLALASLIYRRGNFYNTFIPKPFEMLFVLVFVSTIVYLLKNRKIKEFFLSMPRNDWIAVFCLVASVLFGWAFAVLIKKTPPNFNMVLEFGTFLMGLSAFLFILFYTKNDDKYAKRYFYALLLPVVYIFFVLFPWTADYFLISDGNFLGFTVNQNIISKTLLIPAIFFIVRSLFDFRNKWLRFGCIFVSAALVAMLFWVSSRGALVSLAFGSVFVWLVFSKNNFQWNKVLHSGMIILVIILLGFAMTPGERKKVALNRILNLDSNQISLIALKEKSIFGVARESVYNSNWKIKQDFLSGEQALPDTRLKIWSFYLRYVLKNPVGVGPDTHMASGVISSQGEYVSSGPHNTYIQIWLWGGLLGIFSFLYILRSAFNNLATKLKTNFDFTTVALAGTLFALSISVVFDDSLSFYWFWAILALSLRK